MNPKNIRKPDHTQDFAHWQGSALVSPSQPAQPTNEEIQRHLTRIETRLVVLMNYMGIDTFGNEI